MTPREVQNRRDAEVAQMLVVDRVIRGLLEQIHEIWELRNKDPSVLEQRRHPVHQSVEIVDVRNDVVPDKRRGAAVLRRDLARDGFAEEFVERRDAGGVSHRGNVPRRLDPEDPDGVAVEGAEQSPVVAPDLDD